MTAPPRWSGASGRAFNASAVGGRSLQLRRVVLKTRPEAAFHP